MYMEFVFIVFIENMTVGSFQLLSLYKLTDPILICTISIFYDEAFFDYYRYYARNEQNLNSFFHNNAGRAFQNGNQISLWRKIFAVYVTLI